VDERSIEDLVPDELRQYTQWGGGRGCFTGNTLIETDNGPRPISELEPGDIVLTETGLRVVHAVRASGKPPSTPTRLPM
jgi:Hint domain